MSKGSKGKVVQVIGTVVDVEFPADDLPEIYSAIDSLSSITIFLFINFYDQSIVHSIN